MSGLEQTRPRDASRAKGLVSSRSSGARVHAQTFAPSAAIAHGVEYFWVTRWDLRGQAPHHVELLADPCVNVAFERGRSRIVGVHTRLFRRELAGEGAICAVKFKAGAAKLWLAVDEVASLTDRIVSIDRRSERWLVALESTVLAAERDEDAVALIDRALCEGLRANDNAELATKIVARIEADPTLTSAAAISRAAGLSMRPLQRLFRECVGATPKWVSRRYRLREASQRLERDESVSLSTLAAELGYADHAHFSRDFKAATGHAPSAFARAMRGGS
ncbi:MAG: AraC family transcriptional regulator [Myxococcales bacterium]|nr:AraC family transcriptional regulator [Myxococcales bacterium]